MFAYACMFVCLHTCVFFLVALCMFVWSCLFNALCVPPPPVFECAYRQLILPWYCVPEPPECQPLHQALGREFDLVVDRVISRARDFDLCEAVVGSVRILTQHFHNAKQAER